MASNLPSNPLGKAKESIQGFMSQAGEHDTTVERKEERPVKHETVKPMQHEEVNTAVDKEVHKDHYHRTVQPVKDKQVLPEKHSFKRNQTENREFDYRDNKAAERAQREAAKFHDERNVEGTRYSKENAPTQQGEHMHHHIHETIQPVINKETIQPEVVHTLNPIHETHHMAAEHHGATMNPEISMSEYQRGAGAHAGTRETEYMRGQPKDMGGVKATASGKQAMKNKQPGSGFNPEDEGVAGQEQESSILSGLNPWSK
ncbi:hypothetical protein JX266_002356 [Neoarthrinium moseri]|nr:hypothetical protein JX266_002356 [Neoarthrinium moseri]